MIKHKTTIELPEAAFRIQYQDRILSMGSCFAENIAKKLQQLCYEVSVNAFGTLYNPVSIRNSLGLLLNHYEFVPDDLFLHNGLWNSFQHHSSFSSPNPTAVLEKINVELVKARTRLQQSSVLILTFGTAWVFELKKTGKIVSNCHKIPANRFDRRRLTVAEITEQLMPLFEYLKQHLPDLNIILSVSPIRHLKDGFAENQISKSTLLLAVHEMVQQADYLHYFPAYEIMMDDLRDYRYYADDMVHPSPLAIEYIWEIFSEHYLLPKEQNMRLAIEKIQKAMRHRPFNPDSEAHQNFITQQLNAIDKIHKKAPYINLETAKNHFSAQLIDSE